MILYVPKYRKCKFREDRKSILRLYNRYEKVLDIPYRKDKFQWLKLFIRKLIALNS